MDELTPAELFAMAEARTEDAWNHTASILAMIHNVVSDKKQSPSAFHPMSRIAAPDGPGETSPRDWRGMLQKFRHVLE